MSYHSDLHAELAARAEPDPSATPKIIKTPAQARRRLLEVLASIDGVRVVTPRKIDHLGRRGGRDG